MTVDVYTLPNCQPCTMTKRHMDKRGIDYRVHDVADLPDASAFSSAPVVSIDGLPSWGGYRPDRIDALVSR